MQTHSRSQHPGYVSKFSKLLFLLISVTLIVTNPTGDSLFSQPLITDFTPFLNKQIGLSFLTDLEGIGPRFDYYANSAGTALEYHKGVLRVKPGHVFVYGGDLTDRGPDDLRLLQLMVKLKQTQPQQVVLLLGNRDINKLLLLLKLTPEMTSEQLMEFGDKIGYMKHLLEQINSLDAFTHRKTSLQSLHNRKVTEQEIYQSLMQDLKPAGLRSQYWQLAQIGVIAGQVIAVHGAITESNFGIVPGIKTRYSNPRRWLEHLNKFGNNAIKAALKGENPGLVQLLLDYVTPRGPSKSNPLSAISARFSDPTGNSWMMSPKIRRNLLNHGISISLHGHTPGGQTPWFMSDGFFSTIIADTSMKMDRLDSPSVRIIGNQIYMDGTLVDGRSVFVYGDPSQDARIGRLMKNGYRLIGYISSSDPTTISYLGATVEEGTFKVLYEAFTRPQIDTIGLVAENGKITTCAVLRAKLALP